MERDLWKRMEDIASEISDVQRRNVSGLGLEPGRPCSGCAHMVVRVHDGGSEFLCDLVRNPLTGRPYRRCDYERGPVSMDVPTDKCGPHGKNWEAREGV